MAVGIGGVAAGAGAIDTSEWQFRQSVDIAAPGLTKLALPADTLDHAQAHLADLRLLDPAAEEVPYFVQIPPAGSPSSVAPRSFAVRLERLATELSIDTGTSAPIDGIELVTPARTFVKAARIEASADGEHWRTLAEGRPLTPTEPGRSAFLPVDRIVAAQLRITIDDWRTPPIPFTTVRLRVAPAETFENIPVDAAVTRREEFLGETVLTVALPARHLPLAAIEIAPADPLFSREIKLTERSLRGGEIVETALATGTIARGGEAPPLLRLPLSVTNSAREIQVHIVNQQSPPLASPRITASRRPVWLVFHAPAPGSYTLFTENPHAAPPRYDLARFAEEFRALAPAPISIGPAQPNPGYRPTDPLANAPLVGAELDLGRWTYRKRIQAGDAIVQEVELDWEVLAHARRDLADLRLVRDGRQLAYVLERTSLQRPVPVQLAPADDEQRPRVGRWKLTLPHRGLPLQRLTLDSPAILFSREVRVFEISTDRRGEPFEHSLAPSRTWSRSPAQPGGPFVVGFDAVPETDTIFVEIDHGDNPPIALESARGAYPVTRLLFRSDGRPADLYYGRHDAIAPVYDLQLVAEELLKEDRSNATLGAEEAVGATPRRPGTWLGRRGGVLLWIALGAVVVVLLVVIARLLPKPPPSPPAA